MLSYGTKHSKVAEGYLHSPSCSKMSWFSLCLWEHILFLEDFYVHCTENDPWCLDLLIFLMPGRDTLMLIILAVQKAKKMERDVCTIPAGSCRLSNQRCGCVLPLLHPDKCKFLGLSTGVSNFCKGLLGNGRHGTEELMTSTRVARSVSWVSEVILLI